MNKEMGLVDSLQAVGKAYFEKAQADKHGHGQGPPYLHLFVQLIKWVASSKKGTEDHNNIIAEYWNSRVCQVPRDELAADVLHCRLRPTWKKEVFKFQIAISPSQPLLKAAVELAIIREGGTLKLGGAPAGNAERSVAKLLEATKPA